MPNPRRPPPEGTGPRDAQRQAAADVVARFANGEFAPDENADGEAACNALFKVELAYLTEEIAHLLLDTARQETAAVRGELDRWQVRAQQAEGPWCRDYGKPAVSGACPDHGGDACLLRVAGFVAELTRAEADRDRLTTQIANDRAVEAERLRSTGELMAERDGLTAELTEERRRRRSADEERSNQREELGELQTRLVALQAERDAATAEAAGLRQALTAIRDLRGPIPNSERAELAACRHVAETALATPGTALLAEHAARMGVLREAFDALEETVNLLAALALAHDFSPEDDAKLMAWRDRAERAHRRLATVVGPALGRKG